MNAVWVSFCRFRLSHKLFVMMICSRNSIMVEPRREGLQLEDVDKFNVGIILHLHIVEPGEGTRPDSTNKCNMVIIPGIYLFSALVLVGELTPTFLET